MSIAIEMKDAAAKLHDRALLAQMKPASDHFYDFCALLADRIKDQGELLPQGFAMAVELLIYDLNKGISGYTNEPMNSRLVGLPPVVFRLMKSLLYNRLALVLPMAFVEAVHVFEEEVKSTQEAS